MVCPYCNAPLTQEEEICPNCGKHIDIQMQEPQQSFDPGNDLAEQALPMGWYKFLSKFVLYAAGVLNIFNAISVFRGRAFFPRLAYKTIERTMNAHTVLKVAAVVLSIAYLGLAVFAVYTRRRLASYKHDAPHLLKYYYLVALGLSLLTVVAVMLVGMLPMQAIVSFGEDAIFTIVILMINRTYFKKRAHLFVN